MNLEIFKSEDAFNQNVLDTTVLAEDAELPLFMQENRERFHYFHATSGRGFPIERLHDVACIPPTDIISPNCTRPRPSRLPTLN